MGSHSVAAYEDLSLASKVGLPNLIYTHSEMIESQPLQQKTTTAKAS